MIKKTIRRSIKWSVISAFLFVFSAQTAAAEDVFSSFTWNSPLSVGSIEELVLNILNIIITIAIPVIVLMIIYGGFTYVTARGNAEQIKSATRILTYAIIGGILIIAAVAITGIMEEAVCEFRPEGTPGCEE